MARGLIARVPCSLPLLIRAAFRDSSVPDIGVYACTYQRNDLLATLLRSLLVAAGNVRGRARVGVAVADDNPDGRARSVVQGFAGQFELGVHYRHTGSGNISIARNAGIAAVLEFADLVAMTDDDCEVSPQWFAAGLDMLSATNATAVTGPIIRRYPPGSLRCFEEPPFLSVVTFNCQDGARVPLGVTANTVISAKWLRSHPDARFNPSLGRVGGEDMVFFKRAVRAGLEIRYAADAVVYEIVPPNRTRLSHELWISLYLGNSSSVTALECNEATRLRLVLRGGNVARRGVQRTLERLARGASPQWRHAAAQVLQGLGATIGALGVRLRHH